jgi:hypothetical protein
MLVTVVGGGGAAATPVAALATAGAPTENAPTIARTVVSCMSFVGGVRDMRRTSLWWCSCLFRLAASAASVVGRQGALSHTSGAG